MIQTGSLTPTALGWIREDLDKQVEKVRLQVENIANNPTLGDVVFDGVSESIDTVKYIFETLTLDGGEQIMEGMLNLCQQLRKEEVSSRENAISALLDAMVVLPAYLDRLQAGHQDLPILLLPLINNLRESAGFDPLREGTLFTPLLDVELPELEFVRKPGFDEPFEFLTNRLQRQYDNALQNWLQDQEQTSLLLPLQGICETMRHRMKRYDLKRLWWVATEVISGLVDGHAENDVHLRRLLARLQLLIKTMAESGEDGIDQRTSDSVTQALLYHVANAQRGNSGMDLVNERFELERLAPDSDEMMRARGTLSGRDREMYQSLSAAVKDELSLVKDSLDLELRTGQIEPERRQQSLEALNRLGDTLKMLGLSGAAQSVSRLLPAFEDSSPDDRTAREAALVSLAEQLLLIESALEEQIETLGEPTGEEQTDQDSYVGLSAHEQKRIRVKLLDEAVASVQMAQDAVRRRLAGDLEANPGEPLEHVAGAMHLINEDTTADQTRVLADLLDEKIVNSRSHSPLPREELETLADAMAALELFLAARRDQQTGAKRFNGILQDSLEIVIEGKWADEPEAAASPASEETLPGEQPVQDATAHVNGTKQNFYRQASDETASDTSEQKPHSPEHEAPSGAVTATEPEPVQAAAPAVIEEDKLPPQIDPELSEIFLEEYEMVLGDLHDAIPDWMSNPENINALTDIRRAYHTLKGSGRMVGADELGDFAWQIEDMLNALLEGRIQNIADVSVMIRLSQASLPALRQRLLQEFAGLKQNGINQIGGLAAIIRDGASADWNALQEHLPPYLASLLPGQFENLARPPAEESGDNKQDHVLRVELTDNLKIVQGLLDAISKDRSTRTTSEQVRAIHTIAGNLGMHPEGQDADIAKSLEELLQAQSRSGKPFSPDSLWVLVSAVQQIQNRLDRLDGEGELAPEEEQAELVEQLTALIPQFEGRDLGDMADEVPSITTAEPTFNAGDSQAADAEPTQGFDPGRSVFAGGPDLGADEPAEPIVPQSVEPPVVDEAQASFEETRNSDPEIISIFLEEAHEVLERSDTALNQWRDDLNQLRWVQNLQREIHTFKGGARMAGLTGMGEFTHIMENLLDRIAGNLMKPSVSAVQVLEEACDRLQGWVEQVTHGKVPEATAAIDLLQQQIEALENVSAGGSDAIPTQSAEIQREVQEIPEASQAVAAEVEAVVAGPEKGEEQAGPAQIKVAAELLDNLVNAAGEVSIYRSRLETQVGGIRTNLNEFDETIDRLRDQFRKLEIEIEAQIRSNYPDTHASPGSEFDPLELDQFSTLQQVSRGLSESVSDLLSLQEMLEDHARNAEQLLLKQSRVSTELQEGLMRTRMVPFGSVAPRLRRLVRTSSKETGKRARLQLRMVGTSDELDRNVLEHITAPLEHMMRNAMAHGIEKPDDRKANGKNPEGEITITVESEATEFVIRIADDGAGINLDAIKNRAIERGLLGPEDEPKREQLYDFMMDSGFSTSSQVTRLAGRGVGMDVVSSDIKQIGGSLQVDSEPGQGSQFTIRIPFTLAIMQAIGILAGEQRYLLPLSSVVGVARMLPDDYKKLIADESPTYSFGGQTYPVLDLEPMLGERSRPLARDNVSLLILSAGDQKAAVHVPELLPHREVVIKPVGPQISSVPGILGGSISGDGEVVVILDPGPLIRHALVHGVSPVAAVEPLHSGSEKRLIMVVDDSITMRKVTSRVLEGHDFEVITAKDGVDALEKLQDRSPDLMLFDIEMPRMDGYELTERVREDLRLRETPIMMITSRAGQKHRDRATQAGANAYLTKPYQETELISEVHRLLDEEVH